MTQVAIIEPSIDDRVLSAWMGQARAVDVFEYHRGLLIVDRTEVGPLATEAARAALGQLTDHALRLAEKGRVHLVQRRLVPGAFSYLAIARPPANPRHPEARR